MQQALNGEVGKRGMGKHEIARMTKRVIWGVVS
jgi:hypothetical protein